MHRERKGGDITLIGKLKESTENQGLREIEGFNVIKPCD